MREPKPYALADRAATTLTKRAVQRNKQAKKKLLLFGFDELNVVEEVGSMYEEMDTDNRVKYKELFVARFLELILWLEVTGARIPSDDTIDELAEMYLAWMLSEPNEVTHYAYDTEVYRKRDRAVEAVNAVAGNVLKQVEMDKQLRYWNQMTQQYLDIVSDGATIEAYRAAGIEHVRWKTQEDGRVCLDCDELNDKVFSIDKVPNKQHWRCRCYLVPA